MLIGSNVVGRRIPLTALATATTVGVTLQGLGKFLTPFWLVLGFTIAMYLVGGIGHGLENVTSRTLIHTRIAPERHGRAFAAWNGVRNAAELGALAVGGVIVGALGARETLWLAGGLSALAGLSGWRCSRAAAARPRTSRRARVRSAPREHRHADRGAGSKRGPSPAPERAHREAEASPAAPSEARHRRHVA